MQRPLNSIRDLDLENPQPEVRATPRRRSIDFNLTEMIVTITRYINDWRYISRWYRKPEGLFHLIPVLVVVCFFILWWFSSPVTVPTEEDGEMIHKTILMEMPHDLKNSCISLAILAKAAPPEPLLSGILAAINGTNGQPAMQNATKTKGVKTRFVPKLLRMRD